MVHVAMNRSYNVGIIEFGYQECNECFQKLLGLCWEDVMIRKKFIYDIYHVNVCETALVDSVSND